MRLPRTLGRHPRTRRGSVAIVIIVAVVVAALAAAALTMSGHAGRKEFHQGMRHNAFEVAKAAAEEAALLINNGHANASIEGALDSAVPLAFADSPMMNEDNLEYFGVDAGSRPKVTMRASVVDRFERKPGKAQLDEILAEIAKGGYKPDVVEFWERMKKEQTEESSTLTDDANDRNDAFMDMARNVSIKSWGPEGTPAPCTTDPLTGATTFADPEKRGKRDNPGELDGTLRAMFELFYTHDGSRATDCDGSDLGLAKSGGVSPKGAPAPDAVKRAFEAAIVAIGDDAASKLQGCGSNPNGAVAHAIGDLALGEVIASGTEVSVTTNLMKSRELKDNKVYLLEISATQAYGDTKAMDLDKASGGAAAPEVAFTTYRLFEKVEWENAVMALTQGYCPGMVEGEPGKGIIAEFLQHGMTDSQIASMYPADSAEPGRNVRIPLPSGGFSSLRYDPKKVIWDIFAKSDMPVTAGGRMYPYTIASTHLDMSKAQTVDMGGPTP